MYFSDELKGSIFINILYFIIAASILVGTNANIHIYEKFFILFNVCLNLILFSIFVKNNEKQAWISLLMIAGILFIVFYITVGELFEIAKGLLFTQIFFSVFIYLIRTGRGEWSSGGWESSRDRSDWSDRSFGGGFNGGRSGGSSDRGGFGGGRSGGGGFGGKW